MNVAEAASNQSADICKELAKSKRNAVLLNEKGDALLKHIALGELEVTDPSRAPDYVPTGSRFLLLVRPNTIVLNEDCTSGICTFVKEVSSQCPNSRTFSVTFKLNPRNFFPGHNEVDVDLRLIDKKTDFPVEDDFMFGFSRKLSAAIYRPQIETVSSDLASNQIKELLSGNIGSTTVELVNSGNRPLQLGSWSQVVDESDAVTLNSSACQSMILKAGASCKLTLLNHSRKNVNANFLLWENLSIANGLNFRFYIKRGKDGAIEYDVQNY
jgi:hypothetical protein